MNNYIVIMDPIRVKNFAIATNMDGKINFYPMNEMAMDWALSQKSVKSLSSVVAPDGMYISGVKAVTPSVNILIDSLSATNLNSNYVDENIMSNNLYIGRTKTNFKENKNKISGTQIRKIHKNSRENAIRYKAMAFLGRANRSSAISSVKTRKLKIDKRTASFFDKKIKNVNTIEKSYGANFSRRVASSVFINNNEKSNRLNRRAKSLSYASREETHKKSISECIDFSIDSKSTRFI